MFIIRLIQENLINCRVNYTILSEFEISDRLLIMRLQLLAIFIEYYQGIWIIWKNSGLILISMYFPYFREFKKLINNLGLLYNIIIAKSKLKILVVTPWEYKLSLAVYRFIGLKCHSCSIRSWSPDCQRMEVTTWDIGHFSI